MGRPLDREETDRLESPMDLGRSIVEASAEAPAEAVRFLGSTHLSRSRRPTPGSVPGSMVVAEDSPKPAIRVMSYSSADEAGLVEHAVDRVDELRTLIAIPDRTTWIDVEGFGDPSVLNEIAELFDIHPLAMADLVHVPQRPKAELHDGRLLIIMQMALFTDDGEIDIEQVGMVLGPGWVVSFQDRPGDVFDPVRDRIRSGRSRIRRMGADYLAYALLDALVDGYFPVIETLSGVIDALEEEVIANASRATLARIHATGRTLTMLHRVQWRQRDAIASMLRDEDLPFSDPVKPYLRDVHDHAFQTLDAIETSREMIVGLMDLYLSSTSVRLNEVMKTLTIVATIFIPLTFVTGVYGMNFDHMPELHSRWAYPVVWGLMVSLGAGLLFWFQRRGWLGDSTEK